MRLLCFVLVDLSVRVEELVEEEEVVEEVVFETSKFCNK
jgi:hypothetical protein